MANTILPRAAPSAVHCRSPRSPRAGSATAGPTSSIRRPTIQNARSPRRHRPNRSADAGNCSRPRATACAGKSISVRVRRCAAVGRPHWHNPRKAVTMDASWAACCDLGRGMRGSMAWNSSLQVIVPQFEKYQWSRWQCSKGSMDDQSWRGYFLDDARMTESFGVELGPLPLTVLGLAGKEPN